MNKSDLITQRTQKEYIFRSNFNSLIHFFSLSPRSFLKSYSKLNFQIFKEGSFKLGGRNMLGKVSFNERNFQLTNKRKEVKKIWEIREMMIDRIV